MDFFVWQGIKALCAWETALARAVRSAGAVHALRNPGYTVRTTRGRPHARTSNAARRKKTPFINRDLGRGWVYRLFTTQIYVKLPIVPNH
jgi:hypothetical protein